MMELIVQFRFARSLQGNKLTGKIPEVIGLMQALAVLYVFISICLSDYVVSEKYSSHLSDVIKGIELEADVY